MRADKIDVRGLPYELYLRNRAIIQELAERTRLIRVLLPPPPPPLVGPAAVPETCEKPVVVNLKVNDRVEDGRRSLIVEPASADDVAAIKKWADARKDANHG